MPPLPLVTLVCLPFFTAAGLVASHAIARADVAAVMAEAVVQRSAVRFALCSKLLGKPTTAYAALLDQARWPWQRAAPALAA